MSDSSQNKLTKEFARIDKMSGAKFELYMTIVLNYIGYHNVKHTPQSNDHGLDAIGYDKNGTKVGWQFKNYKNTVPFHSVEEAVFGMLVYDTKINVVLTNSRFSKNTVKLCQRINQTHPDSHIKLVDRTQLTPLIKAYLSKKPQVELEIERKAKKKKAIQEHQKQQRQRKDEEAVAEASIPFQKGLKWLEQINYPLAFKQNSVKQLAYYTLDMLSPLIGYYDRDRIANLKNDLIVNKTFVPLGNAFDRIDLEDSDKGTNPYDRLILVERHHNVLYAYLFIYYHKDKIIKWRDRRAQLIRQHNDYLLHRPVSGMQSWQYPWFDFNPFNSGLFFRTSLPTKHFIISNGEISDNDQSGLDSVRHNYNYHNVPYFFDKAFSHTVHNLDNPDKRPKPLSYHVFDIHTLMALTFPDKYQIDGHDLQIKRDVIRQRGQEQSHSSMNYFNMQLEKIRKDK